MGEVVLGISGASGAIYGVRLAQGTERTWNSAFDSLSVIQDALH